jgi:hypothetical protein
MDHIPAEIILLIAPFAQLFSDRVWQHAQILLLGGILSPNKRTVTAALRAMGLSGEKNWSKYHRVLSRAKWSALAGSRLLLWLIVTLLVAAGAPLILAADDTLERRRGDRIKAKGCYRDAVRSSKKHVVKAFGLKWVVMAILVRVPWSRRVWALPFLTVLAPSEKANQKAGRRHKTSIDWVRQMIKVVRRWWPMRALVLVVDGGFAAVKLALACTATGLEVTMVSRLRLDAGLYHFPPAPRPGQKGKKPKKGKRQRKLSEWAHRSDTPWQEIEVTWYRGLRRKLLVYSNTGLWYTSGWDPVAIRYILVRDPEGQLRDEAFFATDLAATPEQILEWVVMRWSLEVVFEEARAHLGVETQRQWSDRAIARTTPVLFGLFSLVTLWAYALMEGGEAPGRPAAWYEKDEPTFSDLIALVRRQLWSQRYFNKSAKKSDSVLIPKAALELLLDQLCYAA